MAMALTCSSASAATPDAIGDLLHNVQSATDTALKTPEYLMKATYYFIGNKGVRARDSMGCRAVPMRTLAVDPDVVPKGSVVYIKETVGLRMPNGSLHDGLWYASDTGGAIKGKRIDLFTGFSSASMNPLQALNLSSLTAIKVGEFKGCPPK